jgi:hypothetical protein
MKEDLSLGRSELDEPKPLSPRAGESGMGKGEGYNITTSWAGCVLEMRISGQMTSGNPEMIASDVFKIAEDNRPARVLIDVTGFQGRQNISDYFRDMKKFPLVHYIVKTAVVDLPENKAMSSFQETAMVNVGFEIRFFTNLEKARAWLAE